MRKRIFEIIEISRDGDRLSAEEAPRKDQPMGL